ncbi:divalent-cation tolerance protein CutA [Brevibacterium yomogidense]|uniref:divalent-cation tolerance protein CutA n=1 Tax=Brevibacterium yomogidense TaxID=946573 RepID=UPI0018DF68F3|nr:divalent-cation tolerance protein CutA [Brevibacterium yomogidense]
MTTPMPSTTPSEQNVPHPADRSPLDSSTQYRPACVTAQTTVGSRDEAETLASSAVDQGLAACVQVSAVRSFYRWEGKVHSDPEFLLTFKTTAEAAAGPLRAHIDKTHAYDEPEYIVQPITDGSESYLAWIQESVQPAE